ncbi:hypothetical protein ACT7DH_23945 [Bacillus pacificus]
MAVVVTKETKAGEMKQVIAEAGGELLKDVTLFDLYEGEKNGRRQEVTCILY